MKSKKKTILITGCAGFIGSNATDALLQGGYRIIGIDNLASGSLGNLKCGLRNPRFSFNKIDVVDSKKIFNFKSKGIDIILHLAAFKIPLYGNALKTLEINTLGTRNILELTRANRNCKLIFASTSDVYGKSSDIPFNEKADLLLGSTEIKRWAYAVSKIYDEHLVFAYGKEYRIPYVILRYFNTYGPRHPVDSEKVRCGPHTIFIESILDKKPITIYGNGKQKRCFCYIDDTVRGSILAIENKNAIGEIFNIGNNKTEISILDLAYMIMKFMEVQSTQKIKFIPYRKAFKSFEDVKRRIPDIRKAKALLHFEPKVSNEEGIRRTIAWHKSLRENEIKEK